MNCSFCNSPDATISVPCTMSIDASGRATLCQRCAELAGKIAAAQKANATQPPPPVIIPPPPTLQLAPTAAEIEAFVVAWREARADRPTTISRATFEGMDLQRIDFSGCTFDGCVLRGVNLKGSTLRNCTFNHCDLIGTKLVDVDASGADFSGSHFGKAGLSGGKFTSACFNSCNFGGAMLACSHFEGAAFKDTVWETAVVTSCWIGPEGFAEIEASLAGQRCVEDVVKGFAVVE